MLDGWQHPSSIDCHALLKNHLRKVVEMPVVTDRSQTLDVLARLQEAKVVMPVFCYDSLMNLEANLHAVKEFAQEYCIKNPILAPSVTFGYEDMQQAARVLRWGSTEEGLKVCLAALDILCGTKGATYYDVVALPHIDHADAEAEEWVWSKYQDKLATIMIDASLGDRSLEENIELTSRMVDKYKKHIVIEAALQRPAVEGQHEADHLAGAETDEAYAGSARSYVEKTGTDLIVVELGSKQQALGWADYNSERARRVTEVLGAAKIVLHGGSSIPLEQLSSLAYDGVIRFNIWTRLGREGARAAAEAIVADIDAIRGGDPEQKYYTRYRNAHFDAQVRAWKDVLKSLGYERLAG
jgi:fructose/tagatose bisphosphate aldolase